MPNGFLLEGLMRHMGQTVTIFTTSGGISGAGFTGVLVGIGECTVRLITDIGAPPACPVGSSCGFNGFGNFTGGCNTGCGCNRGFGSGYLGTNWLGSITEIPI